MKHFDINTPFKGNGVYRLKVKDRTHTILKNGVKIPSQSMMLRLAAKSGR